MAARRRLARDDEVIAVIRDFDLAMQSWRSRFAHEQRINPHDTLVISALAAAGGPARPREIAQSLRITSGTLTTMIDRLETAGLVQRQPNPKDRRSILLALTDEGAGAVAQRAKELGAAVGAAIPADLRERFLDCMRDAAAAIRDVADERR